MAKFSNLIAQKLERWAARLLMWLHVDSSRIKLIEDQYVCLALGAVAVLLGIVLTALMTWSL